MAEMGLPLVDEIQDVPNIHVNPKGIIFKLDFTTNGKVHK